ncbi:MAG TPA: hypothetical protein VMU43_01615 [Candidatus Acidoferrum sp.]|nr:hypothetical protein [Candidatus Acidoferrum sp.]
MLAGGIQFEHAPRDRRFIGINLDGVFELVVAVPQRWAARINALFGLFPHSFANLFAQVFDVIPCNHHLNAVDKLCLGFGVLADDLALFRQMDFDIEVFERDAIAEVAIKPVGLFHDGDATGWILPEEADHLVELLAARSLSRFHIDEFVHDFEFVRLGILAQQFQLRGNGIAFALLVFAGNASVDDGLSHATPAQRSVSLTMRSGRFQVNRDCARFRRIFGLIAYLLHRAVPVIQQQEHVAKQAQSRRIEGFSPCGRLFLIIQFKFNFVSRFLMSWRIVERLSQFLEEILCQVEHDQAQDQPSRGHWPLACAEFCEPGHLCLCGGLHIEINGDLRLARLLLEPCFELAVLFKNAMQGFRNNVRRSRPKEISIAL